MHAIDERCCPKCGQPNECNMAAGDCRDCWCSRVAIPPTILASLPEKLQGRACLCRRCAQGEVAAPCAKHP